MLEIVLTYPTDEGSEEIALDGDKVSFGRGSEAEYRFTDDGLSRLHATIYREDNDVWVVDENSSNGTFVNGEKVGVSGTPLIDGDTVKIGHYTNIKIAIQEKSAIAEPTKTENYSNTKTVASANVNNDNPSMLIPLVITAFALLIIGSSAVFIGYIFLGNNNNTEIAQIPTNDDDFDLSDDETTSNDNDDNSNDTDEITSENSGGKTTSPQTGNNTPQPIGTDSNNEDITNSPTAKKNNNPTELLSGRAYQQLSSDEKNRYVQLKAERVAQIIGNSSSNSIPPQAVAKIRRFLDAYVNKLRKPKKDDCSMRGWVGSDMTSVMKRASQNAPFIIRAFNEKDIDPKVGLYLAMIESEHCPCLRSPTGPLGLFQFTTATGRNHGLNTRSGATPSNPDERCKKEPAARAAASYMKSLSARIGTGPLSIPLAVASYNSGEGGLGSNLKKALTANESQERSFWTLVVNADKLAAQFQRENIKYVPKFFAAAIIGENPKDFGIDMLPLSTYTK